MLVFLFSALSFGETKCYKASLSLVKFLDSSHMYMLNEVDYAESDIWNQNLQYLISEESELKFLTVSNGTSKEKFLILMSDDILVLYDGLQKEPVFFGMRDRSSELCRSVESIKASSELREKSKLYSVDNLATFDLEAPWVEGVPGHGIGESVSFSVKASCLYFFSGYVSAKKPHLYLQNSRPKRIKLTLAELNEDLYFDLEDSPNPQKLDIGKFYRGEIIVEILDVYPGSKYEDTCVNAIRYDFGRR